MAHEVLFANSANGYIRQLRSFLMNAPRVNRPNDHDDINNLGVTYTLGIGGSRPAGDTLHVAAEVGCPQTTHRATVVVPKAVEGSWGALINRTVTFNTGARTITDDAVGDWGTAGVVAGDLIRLTAAVNAGNSGVWKVATIGGTNNSVLTLDALDTLAASTAADNVDIYPITGGTIFNVREDQPGANTHIGWMMDGIEFMSKTGDIWLFMRSGGSWAINDYAQWVMEAGAFTMNDEWVVTRTVDMNENGGSADTITRVDYNGNFLRDGFVSGGRVTIEGSTSNDGTYDVTTATATTLTLPIGALTADQLGASVKLTPRLSRTVDFAASPTNTITRASGSWLTDGFLPGGQILIADAVDTGNNGLKLITTVTALVITLDASHTMLAETADVITCTPRNSILQTWGEHRYYRASDSYSLAGGALPIVPNTDGNYASEWVAIAPGDDPVNNPQTIYCGWQSQFSGASVQNIEQRYFDAVSDSAFGSLGNASPPTYLYLTLSPSMELFMTADGAHVAGFLDVNTSVTEWFYLGFGRVHGSQNQHPRPLINGGMSGLIGGSRVGSGALYRFFLAGMGQDATTNYVRPPEWASCWHRWVDGQHFSVANFLYNSVAAAASHTSSTLQMVTWPYSVSSSPLSIDWDFNNGGTLLQQNLSNNPSSVSGFMTGLRATPTTITPNPNREYPLIPVTLLMVAPDNNIVADFRNVYFIPGNGQASKNRVLQGGYTYIVGQNHEKVGQEDFAALRLN